MNKIIVVNETYLADYYNKRIMFNRLKEELDEMSSNIKRDLEFKNVPLGKRYGHYVASVNLKNKLNSNFIQMLKDNGMQNRITEVCHIKDCEDIISDFSPKEQELYIDFWYKQLRVRKE